MSRFDRFRCCRCKPGWTPLEKAAGEVGGENKEADGGSMLPSANTSGFTLIELIMVTIILGIMVSVSYDILKSSLDVWRKAGVKGELWQEARIAMHRITEEVRYATGILNNTTGLLEFNTTCLLDTDSGTEKIKYNKSGTDLYRYEDTTGSYGGGYLFVSNVSDFQPSIEGNLVVINLTLQSGADIVNLRGGVRRR